MRFYVTCPRVAPPLAGLGGECNCHGCGHTPVDGVLIPGTLDEAVSRMVALWLKRNPPEMSKQRLWQETWYGELLRAAVGEA